VSLIINLFAIHCSTVMHTYIAEPYALVELCFVNTHDRN